MKTILIYISILCYTVNVYAQTNYYPTTKTFYEAGYTYQCDVAPSKMAILYNKSNQWTYADQVYKSSGKPFIMPDNHFLDLTDNESWKRNRPKLNSIVNAAFSTEEKQRVEGHKLGLGLYINPITGKVDEVLFEFATFTPYSTIPVSVYRKIEMDIKNNISYTLTPEGKLLNIIGMWWSQEVE